APVGEAIGALGGTVQDRVREAIAPVGEAIGALGGTVQDRVREAIAPVDDAVRGFGGAVIGAMRDAVAPIDEAVRAVEGRIAGLPAVDVSPILDRLDAHAQVLEALLEQVRAQSGAEAREGEEIRNVLQSSVKRIREGLCRLQEDLAELKVEAESVTN
ncbi:MAG: hypothetical protein JXP34_13835, partial [Planctomycetes bacterium]|nr:hypothetical protein [Planctomycetota bacterium]